MVSNTIGLFISSIIKDRWGSGCCTGDTIIPSVMYVGLTKFIESASRNGSVAVTILRDVDSAGNGSASPDIVVAERWHKVEPRDKVTAGKGPDSSLGQTAVECWHMSSRDNIASE